MKPRCCMCKHWHAVHTPHVKLNTWRRCACIKQRCWPRSGLPTTARQTRQTHGDCERAKPAASADNHRPGVAKHLHKTHQQCHVHPWARLRLWLHRQAAVGQAAVGNLIAQHDNAIINMVIGLRLMLCPRTAGPSWAVQYRETPIQLTCSRPASLGHALVVDVGGVPKIQAIHERICRFLCRAACV